MQIRRQESSLEVRLLVNQQGLCVPVRQRSIEFRYRFTPMESDPSKETHLGVFSPKHSSLARIIPRHAWCGRTSIGPGNRI